jgi:hypothetical protein
MRPASVAGWPAWCKAFTQRRKVSNSRMRGYFLHVHASMYQPPMTLRPGTRQ